MAANNLGDMITRLRALMDRKDIPRALAVQFVQDAITDLEHMLRITRMEIVLQVDPFDGSLNSIKKPTGFLQMIDMFSMESSGTMREVSMDQWLKLPQGPGIPQHFASVADRWMLRPTPQDGLVVYIRYYGETKPLVVDTDSNFWTTSCTTCLLYTAAEKAAHWFQDASRTELFGAKATELRELLISQDLDEKFAGPLTVARPSGDY